MSRMASTLQQAKGALRKELKLRLSKMAPDDRLAQSNIIADKVFQMPQYISSKRVCIYLHMAEEVYTVAILKRILATQKTCFIPHYMYKGSVMKMVPLTSWAQYEGLPLTKWNIKQPHDEDVHEDALDSGGLDLILMPGLGFTKHGDRIGRGKGYYDTYLQKCRDKGYSPTTIALAYDQQICDSIPVSEHDQKIYIVLYPGQNLT